MRKNKNEVTFDSSYELDEFDNFFTRLFKLPNGLSKVRRYSRDFMHRPETVLEHSATVGMFTTLIGMYINEKTGKKTVDLGKVALKSLFHDSTEYLTGDCPRLTKYSSKQMKHLYDKLDVACCHTLSEYIDINKKYFEELVINAKDESLEGFLLKVADIFSVINQCYVEVYNLGNIGFHNVFKECMAILDTNLISSAYEKWNSSASKKYNEKEREIILCTIKLLIEDAKELFYNTNLHIDYRAAIMNKHTEVELESSNKYECLGSCDED